MKRSLAIAQALAIAFAFGGSAVYAQTSTSGMTKDQKMQRRADFEKKFKAADKDGNGLTKDEIKKGFPHLNTNFDAIDANKNGKVTWDEYTAWEKAQSKAKNKK